MTRNSPSIEEKGSRQAFESIQSDLRRLRAAEIISVNLDVPKAVVAFLGRVPMLRKFQRDLVKLPVFEAGCVDKLETFALALGYAHAQLMASTPRPKPEVGLANKLAEMRETLVSDAIPLCKRGLIDSSKLNELHGVRSFKNLVLDMTLLAALFRKSWANIEGKTLVTLQDIAHAEQLAKRMANALGDGHGRSLPPRDAVIVRKRAFTLFVRSYEEVRRGVAFVRWHERDVDRIVPSLWSNPKKSRSKRRATSTNATSVCEESSG